MKFYYKKGIIIGLILALFNIVPISASDVNKNIELIKSLIYTLDSLEVDITS